MVFNGSDISDVIRAGGSRKFFRDNCKDKETEAALEINGLME